MLTTLCQIRNRGAAAAIAFLVAMFPVRSHAWGAQINPEEMLGRVLKSEERVSFAGTSKVVIWSKSGKKVTRTHVVSLANVISRTDYLGPGREKGRVVVSEGRDRLEYDPSLKLAVISHEERGPNSDAAIANSVRRLAVSYQLELNERATLIQNRPTIVLRLNPILGDRPRSKWWIDLETAHIVRREIFDISGHLRQLSQIFVETYAPQMKPKSLRFAIPQHTKIKRRKTNAMLNSVQHATKEAPKWSIIPESIGDGFEFDHARIVGHRGTVNLQVQYTDGLIALSLFEAPGRVAHTRFRNAHSVMLGKNRKATIELIMPYNVLTWNDKNRTYHLVGDVAEKTLVDVATKIIQ